jgi:HSP20 family protein
MRPIEDLERVFDEFVRRPWLGPWRDRQTDWRLPLDVSVPKLDVIDRDSEVVVKAELPGVKKEDVEISISGDVLTLKGETKREEKEEKGDFYRCEISQGSFWRTVTLPAEVNEAGAKAQLRDGMLEVTLPKAEKAKKRPIKVE